MTALPTMTSASSMTGAGRLALVVAGISAAIGFGVPAANAGTVGNAPWCAVLNLGTGGVEWDCEFRSVEECQPQVIAGNRGFCNLNPYFVARPAAYAAPVRHRKRHS
jgi:hypothetical protein